MASYPSASPLEVRSDGSATMDGRNPTLERQAASDLLCQIDLMIAAEERALRERALQLEAARARADAAARARADAANKAMARAAAMSSMAQRAMAPPRSAFANSLRRCAPPPPVAAAAARLGNAAEELAAAAAMTTLSSTTSFRRSPMLPGGQNDSKRRKKRWQDLLEERECQMRRGGGSAVEIESSSISRGSTVCHQPTESVHLYVPPPSKKGKPAAPCAPGNANTFNTKAKAMPAAEGGSNRNATASKKKRIRPYSEYNLFFILERALMLQSGHTCTPVTADLNKSTERKAIDCLPPGDDLPPMPQRYQNLVVDARWYDSRNKAKKKERRVHRKSHGVGFMEMTKLISNKWKQVDAETKAFLKAVATNEMKRYNERKKLEEE